MNITNRLSSFLLRNAACSFAVSVLDTTLQRGIWNKAKVKLASVVAVFVVLESALILAILLRLTGLIR